MKSERDGKRAVSVSDLYLFLVPSLRDMSRVNFNFVDDILVKKKNTYEHLLVKKWLLYVFFLMEEYHLGTYKTYLDNTCGFVEINLGKIIYSTSFFS